MAKAGECVIGGDRIEPNPDRVHQGVHRSGSSFPQRRLKPAEDQLDRGEVRRVCGQKSQVASCRLDRLPRARALVHAQVVEDHDLSRAQRRDEMLLDPLGEEIAVQSPREDHRWSDPRRTQRRQIGDIWHVIAGDRCRQPLATWSPTVRAGQRRLGAGLVEEDEVRRNQRRLRCLPDRPMLEMLSGGDQALFLRVRSSRATARQTVVQPTTI